MLTTAPTTTIEERAVSTSRTRRIHLPRHANDTHPFVQPPVERGGEEDEGHPLRGGHAQVEPREVGFPADADVVEVDEHLFVFWGYFFGW